MIPTPTRTEGPTKVLDNTPRNEKEKRKSKTREVKDQCQSIRKKDPFLSMETYIPHRCIGFNFVACNSNVFHSHNLRYVYVWLH